MYASVRPVNEKMPKVTEEVRAMHENLRAYATVMAKQAKEMEAFKDSLKTIEKLDLSMKKLESNAETEKRALAERLENHDLRFKKVMKTFDEQTSRIERVQIHADTKDDYVKDQYYRLEAN